MGKYDFTPAGMKRACLGAPICDDCYGDNETERPIVVNIALPESEKTKEEKKTIDSEELLNVIGAIRESFFHKEDTPKPKAKSRYSLSIGTNDAE